MGGAMDLVSSTKKVICVMSHLDKHNKSKIVGDCTLPVTGPACIDLLITEKAVFNFKSGKIQLQEISEKCSLEELRQITDADFDVADNLGKMEDFESKYVGDEEDEASIFK